MDHTKIPVHLDPQIQILSGVARHGMKRFECTVISHVEGNLFMGGCVDGLVLPPNIKHVVSLYPWERYVARHETASELYFRAYDADVETFAPELERLAKWIGECLDDGPTLVHCQAGLNRSGLLSALTLIRRGKTPVEAISLLRSKRSDAVLCNQSFERWLLALSV